MRLSLGLAFGLAVAAVLVPAPSYADEPSAQAIEAATGVKGLVRPSGGDANEVGAATTRDKVWASTTTVRIARDARRGVSIVDSGSGSVVLGLPGGGRPVVSAKGTVVYPGTGFRSAVQTTVDGTVRGLVEAGKVGPRTFRFPLTVPQGARIARNADGSLDVMRGATPVGHLDAPWAKYTKGGTVPASFGVDGTTVVLRLGQGNASRLVAGLSYHAAPGKGGYRGAATIDATKRSRIWTTEEMRQAKPLDAPEVAPKGTRRSEPARTARAAAATDPAAGAMFFSFLGVKKRCTATVVHRNLIATAAHCIQQGGIIFNRWTFVPQYDKGATPYGSWKIKTIYYDQRWGKLNNNPDFDYAFISLQPQNGKYVGDVVPWGRAKLTDLSWRGACSGDGCPEIPTHVTGYPKTLDSPLECFTQSRLVYISENGGKGSYHYTFPCKGYAEGVSGTALVGQFPAQGHPGYEVIFGVLGGYQGGGDTDDISYASYWVDGKSLFDDAASKAI
ncbi:trypsin-like serine peptidase [Actinomadura sp. 6N118]|uniref:trypsin-like serine peptidase n=1 Tax=Actinomadura sp. 6N118 TaxID=3375151 RepID=UPI0037AFBB8B